MDFRVGEVLRLLGKTAPFLVLRFLVYMGIALGSAVLVGVGAGMGALVGSVGDDSGLFGLWGGLLGLGLAAAILSLLREYLLYLVKAGHIAVLVELMDGTELPQGRGQIDYAQRLVRERFVQSSVLFGVDQVVKGILKALNRVFLSVGSILPLPGLRGLIKVVNAVFNLSLTYVDEVILAYTFRKRAANPWESSLAALMLYAQSYKSFLSNAVFVALFVWGVTILVFVVVLGPAAAVVSLIPGTAGVLTFILALVVAWGVKQALIEPVGMVALMQVFFKVTEGQVPNPEWEAKLASLSPKVQILKERARDWRPAPAPTLIPPGA